MDLRETIITTWTRDMPVYATRSDTSHERDIQSRFTRLLKNNLSADHEIRIDPVVTLSDDGLTRVKADMLVCRGNDVEAAVEFHIPSDGSTSNYSCELTKFQLLESTSIDKPLVGTWPLKGDYVPLKFPSDFLKVIVGNAAADPLQNSKEQPKRLLILFGRVDGPDGVSRKYDFTQFE